MRGGPAAAGAASAPLGRPRNIRLRAARDDEVASRLPFAYCGDPASFERETDLVAYLEADCECDARKVQAVLRGELPRPPRRDAGP